jgi:hypothetical protein
MWRWFAGCGEAFPETEGAVKKLYSEFWFVRGGGKKPLARGFHGKKRCHVFCA